MCNPVALTVIQRDTTKIIIVCDPVCKSHIILMDKRHSTLFDSVIMQSDTADEYAGHIALQDFFHMDTYMNMKKATPAQLTITPYHFAIHRAQQKATCGDLREMPSAWVDKKHWLASRQI